MCNQSGAGKAVETTSRWQQQVEEAELTREEVSEEGSR